MRVRITRAPPVEAKHGMTVGRKFEVLRENRHPPLGGGDTGRPYLVFVQGDAGEEVGLHWRHECEEVKP